MSTSLYANSNLIFGNVLFVIGIFDICGRKMRFSENSQNALSGKLIFGQFEVIFLNV